MTATLLHVEIEQTEGRVRMKITPLEGVGGLVGIMTPAEARHIAQKLIRAAAGT